MEVFKAIIELIDKIIWPFTILIIFLSLRTCLKSLINFIPYILEKKGGEIKTPWGEINIPLSQEKAILPEEIKNNGL